MKNEKKSRHRIPIICFNAVTAYKKIDFDFGSFLSSVEVEKWGGVSTKGAGIYMYTYFFYLYYLFIEI